MAVGLALQALGLAWIAAVSTATVGYASLVGPFILSGIGMAMFFAPVANVVLSAVRPQEEGKASGTNNAIREVGGVLGGGEGGGKRAGQNPPRGGGGGCRGGRCWGFFPPGGGVFGLPEKTGAPEDT